MGRLPSLPPSRGPEPRSDTFLPRKQGAKDCLIPQGTGGEQYPFNLKIKRRGAWAA